MKKAVVYIHGMGGNAYESEHYADLFPEDDVIGFDYRSSTPWEAKEEFPAFFDSVKQDHSSVIVIANSIGAYFALVSLADMDIEQVFMISPIVNMEKLILDMMSWAGVTEEMLRDKGVIETGNGSDLSWEYLSWVRDHSISWKTPVSILYGSLDNLQSEDTIRAFAQKTGADITVMENGEHWFHTDEQMAFLDAWIRRKNKEILQ